MFNCLVDARLPAKYANDPLAKAVLREGLLIQDRFSAEPVYAKTGKGNLKSAGVDELKKIKAAAAKNKKSKT